MSKFPRDEAPTVAPKFDMQTYARESERTLREASAAPADPALELDLDHDVTPRSVPAIASQERALEGTSLPTESFLLAFFDGKRDVATIAALSGLPADLVAVTVADLARAGVITLQR